MMISMQAISKYLCCPDCQKEIVLKENEAFYCPFCNHTYPIVCGIPDFRVFAPPYIDIENDLNMARVLDSKFDALDYEDFVRFRMDMEKERDPSYPEDMFEGHLQFRLADREKAESVLKLLDGIGKGYQDNEGKNIGLDIGCGTGAGVLAIANRYDISVGVDILLSDIIIAKKLLQRASCRNIHLH